MEREVHPWEVVAGKRYKIVQEFTSGTHITTIGLAVTDANDEYVFIRDVGRLNLHPYIAMPQVHIWEV